MNIDKGRAVKAIVDWNAKKSLRNFNELRKKAFVNSLGMPSIMFNLYTCMKVLYNTFTGKYKECESTWGREDDDAYDEVHFHSRKG